MSVFADRLKTAMQQANVTSAQLSKQTGIGRSSISQWLSSKYVAKHDKVTTLAQALAVNPDWLLGAEPVVESTTDSPVTSLIDDELTTLWQQLDAVGQQKLLKKARKLVAKQAQPTVKPRKKGKKKKAKKK
jgi:transcriptional regulator with XRE-family HTH domain